MKLFRLARRGEQAGQSLLEFALVLLFVILPFMFVLTDSAVTLYSLAVLTNAAREGARAGSIYQVTTPPDPNQTFNQQYTAADAARLAYVQSEVQRMTGALFTINPAQCTPTVDYNPLTPPDTNPERALDLLTVTLACPRRLFFGLIGSTQITLSASSTMHIEPGGVAPGP